MKVYVVADFEGVSGVDGYDIFNPSLPGDVAMKTARVQYWVEDLNAAVLGAVAAGAEEIVILDNHSSGRTIPLGQLVGPARLVHGSARPTWLPLLDSTFDALVFIGQHAMANTRNGHLCHTYSRQRIDKVVLNGREIGEIGLAAGIAGCYGVPLAFLSGDDKAVAEARDLVPMLAAAAVKFGLSTDSCASLPRDEAVRLIKDGVELALKDKPSEQTAMFEPPLELSVEYRWPESWRAAAKSILRPRSGKISGVRRLTIRGDSLQDMWDRIIGLGE
jgi:D-amino peptidase